MSFNPLGVWQPLYRLITTQSTLIFASFDESSSLSYRVELSAYGNLKLHEFCIQWVVSL